MDNPLREWRKTKGLRAVDIALMLSLSERAILAYETGAFRPKNDHFNELAKIMATTSDVLKNKWNDWLDSKRHAEA